VTFCPSCGNELESNAKFCPKCGKQNEPQQPTRTVIPSRPTGITILGILHILGGIVFAAAALVFGAASTMMGNSFMGGFMSVVGGALAAVFVIVAILDFAIASALFSGKRWGRTVVIVLSIIDLIFEVVSIAGGNVFSIAGIILDLIVLYYMWRPHVIAYFYK